MTLRNPRMGAISTTAVCYLPESGECLSRPRLPDGSLANQDGELIRETLPVTGHRFWTLGQGGIYFVDAQTSRRY